MAEASKKRLTGAFKLAAVAISGALSFTAAQAQSNYPNKPIKFVVPYSAGTTTDVIARVYADKLGKVLGQNVIVDNKAGAGGNISAESVARSAPDGYTLTFSTSATHATNPALYKNVSFDPIKDFTHIAMMVSAPNMLAINPKIPVNNMAELIAYAKKNPGKLTYISAGSGTSPHMAGELLKTMAGIDIQHVPYKNINQGFTDLFAGTVSMTFYHVPVIYPHVKEGRLKALGVATSERSPIAPEVPPISDTVKGYDLRPWWGLAGPAGMPKDVVDKLYAATTQVLADPEVQERFKNLGLIITPMTPQQFNDFTVTELAKWSKIVKDSGATAN
ncbi:Bug family tripartite tricarboxylate transporter substrate binding protein [Zwartia panacis]|uniref:Bug family tripartite tricarboxylate transporter substrate binding protein n=1 Tax=Zwartia panacis TaxID=2683345 RepID=UPI0025B3B639|nr:tripartite tricarboxylate transporter substrate binding protein [Zwartia panacis]MDN4018260.1 tripartite tricarboxylate transporter substrate binding protein [Zwartia panacis]